MSRLIILHYVMCYCGQGSVGRPSSLRKTKWKHYSGALRSIQYPARVITHAQFFIHQFFKIRCCMGSDRKTAPPEAFSIGFVHHNVSSTRRRVDWTEENKMSRQTPGQLSLNRLIKWFSSQVNIQPHQTQNKHSV